MQLRTLRGPKVRPKVAQGIALGQGSHKKHRALKGRPKRGWTQLDRPFRAPNSTTFVRPRAMPWAFVDRAVGPEECHVIFRNSRFIRCQFKAEFRKSEDGPLARKTKPVNRENMPNQLPPRSGISESTIRPIFPCASAALHEPQEFSRAKAPKTQSF